MGKKRAEKETMKLRKALHLALNILIHSKLRSWLTIIGIIIGIGSIVAIISVSEGAQKQLQDRLSGLGADILTVSPGFSRAGGPGGSFRGPAGEDSSTTTTTKNLTSKDVLVLKNVPNVKYVLGLVSSRDTLSISGQTATVSITGVDETVWKHVTTDTLTSGRFLSGGDTYSVVLGGNLVTNTFKGKINLNNKVIIAGKAFNVVGIETEGNGVYIPIAIARQILSTTDVGNVKFNSIQVKIADVDLSDQTVNDTTAALMLSRGILNDNKKDFSVTSPKAFQQTMTSTLNSLSLFLGFIAAISLVVGGIGIANTMFTSVLEKTREIGTMKAIGAENKDIMLIFLFNAGLIGLVGGIGGVIVGTFASVYVGMLGGISTGGGPGGIGRFFGSSAIVSPEVMVFAILFSMLVGMIAGAIPAYRASKLNPVDALRYE